MANSNHNIGIPELLDKEQLIQLVIEQNKLINSLNEEKDQLARALLKSNQLYLFVNKLNQTITRCHDVQSLFEAICHTAVDSGIFKMAWIGSIDENTKIVMPIAFAGHEGGYLSKIKITIEDTPEGNGPTGTALREMRSVICNDIRRDPNMAPWKEIALETGFYSSIALPIIKSGKTIYVFTLYASEINFFNKEEIKLLQEACFDVSFTIERLEMEKRALQLATAIEQSSATIVITDTKGNIEYLNPTFTQKTGYSMIEALGKNPRILKSGYTSDLEYKEMWQRITGGDAWQGEFQNRKKNGDIYWESAIISPVKNAEGDIISFLAVKDDITERKREEETKKTIMNDILQRNKDLEQFSYIVSHNLRAPVANIIGITRLLKENIVKKDEKKIFLDGLLVSSEKLDMVIRDLNDVLQIRQTIHEKKEMVEFSGLVSDISNSIADLIHATNAKIISNFSSVGGMLGLKSYFYSIFYNLISNSLKYRKEGVDPIIEITSIKTNRGIEINFKDNGLGIDLKKTGDHIFGLYKRFHNHTEGKGMGLFMVKSQVETLGGRIFIESEVNSGTLFRIVFEHLNNGNV